MSIEFELKYNATPQILGAIDRTFREPAQTITMQTDYYDTPDGDLAARKITLRRRLENGVSVCTLKTPAIGGARGEYEGLWDSIAVAFPELCKLANMPELLPLQHKGLQCVCGARFTRSARQLVLPLCTVELALDQGFLTGGGRQVPLCEAEVELKSGSREAACAFAAQLAAVHGLQPEARSKFSRARALAKGE